ncbi:response regulator [Rhizobium wenxiniae]|uniref:response regulator n=1 Tax=Rhizobium wenxiniae TaxID=1737357 RepID=UPI001C6E9081|nr:response regulator [Rhizobium wenxiniae]MBW9091717.1 response regulator [Rhizobium wenxiniae]
MGQSKLFNTHSILIVDDEAILRFDLADFFMDAGYHVYDAADADEAIAILEAHDSIRVVLTDVQMPGSMDGMKLAHYIRDRYPPTVLLVTSGMRKIELDEMPENSLFITKPFDPNRLLKHIEEIVRT